MTTPSQPIKTSDGQCPSYTFRPTGTGPWPAVLVSMDGIGIRPAVLELGARLAMHGYYVLVPDLYYRSGPYEPIFTDPPFATRTTWSVWQPLPPAPSEWPGPAGSFHKWSRASEGIAAKVWRRTGASRGRRA
jgi:carboxymethylenebutenolidase